MAEKELKIRDFLGDYALDIPTDLKGSIITLYFNSRRNAENVKRIIEVDGSKPNEEGYTYPVIKLAEAQIKKLEKLTDYKIKTNDDISFCLNILLNELEVSE